MKKFIDLLVNDYEQEGFTKRDWIVYGVFAPAVVIVGCLLAEWIVTL